MSGSMLPDPDCIPGSTYICPLSTLDLPDIKGDRSLSALYFFPKQLTPHRSVLLPGVRRPRPILTEADRETARRGGRGRGRGGHMDGGRGSFGNANGYGNGNRDYNGRGDYQRSQNGYGNNSYQRGNYSSSQHSGAYGPSSYQQSNSYQSYQNYQSQHQPYQQS